MSDWLTAQESDFLTPDEAAQYLRRSKRTLLENYAKLKDFPRPCRPAGGDPLYVRDELRAWLLKQRTT